MRVRVSLISERGRDLSCEGMSLRQLRIVREKDADINQIERRLTGREPLSVVVGVVAVAVIHGVEVEIKLLDH